jgi:regulator of extracellular matrix RemA (YlzA/DUF370 family)
MCLVNIYFNTKQCTTFYTNTIVYRTVYLRPTAGVGLDYEFTQIWTFVVITGADPMSPTRRRAAPPQSRFAPLLPLDCWKAPIQPPAEKLRFRPWWEASTDIRLNHAQKKTGTRRTYTHHIISHHIISHHYHYHIMSPSGIARMIQQRSSQSNLIKKHWYTAQIRTSYVTSYHIILSLSHHTSIGHRLHDSAKKRARS